MNFPPKALVQVGDLAKIDCWHHYNFRTHAVVLEILYRGITYPREIHAWNVVSCSVEERDMFVITTQHTHFQKEITDNVWLFSDNNMSTLSVVPLARYKFGKDPYRDRVLHYNAEIL